MLTSTIENVLNRGLPRSPRARALCRELEGRRLGVDVRGMARLLVESTGDTLRITRDSAAPAEAEISGGPFSLMALDFPAARDEIVRRYPFFRSSAFERRMLFDFSPPSIASQSAA